MLLFAHELGARSKFFRTYCHRSYDIVTTATIDAEAKRSQCSHTRPARFPHTESPGFVLTKTSRVTFVPLLFSSPRTRGPNNGHHRYRIYDKRAYDNIIIRPTAARRRARVRYSRPKRTDKLRRRQFRGQCRLVVA